MRQLQYSLIIAVLAVAPALGKMMGPSKKLILDSMRSCSEGEDLPLTLKDMSVVQADRNTYLVNGVMVYNAPIVAPWSMYIVIEKCQSAQNPDSCETWFTYDVPDLCPKLPEKNQLWSDFIEKTNMSTTCPMEPNEYIMKDIPIDASNLERIPMYKAAFRFHVDSKSGTGEQAACITAEVEIVPNSPMGK